MTLDEHSDKMNPLEPRQPLKSPSYASGVDRKAHPQKHIHDEDSAVTKAEKIERHGGPDEDLEKSLTKRIKTDALATQDAKSDGLTRSERRKGVAPIKPESVQRG